MQKPWKNSCIRSTSKSLIYCLGYDAVYSTPGLPEKSITTLDKASSKGTYACPYLLMPSFPPMALSKACPNGRV